MPHDPLRDLVIRPASEADAPLLHAFAQVLAEHEGDPSLVTSSVEDMRVALFGEHSITECVIAQLDGEPVGCAVFCPKYASYSGRNEIYLEDLVVSPGARGRGVGLRLLAHVARVALDRGATRLEWFVVKSNARAIEFYRRLGAQELDNVTVMRLGGEDLGALARRLE